MVRTVYTQNVLYNKNNIDYYNTVVLGRTWGFLEETPGGGTAWCREKNTELGVNTCILVPDVSLNSCVTLGKLFFFSII